MIKFLKLVYRGFGEAVVFTTLWKLSKVLNFNYESLLVLQI